MSETTEHPDARDDNGQSSSGAGDGDRDVPTATAAAASGADDGDPVDKAMKRLRDADPGDTQEVLDAGNEANDRLQERLHETAPE